MAKSKLTVAQVLAWADAHQARAGCWPSALSGPVAGSAGETWGGLDKALREGYRGLPGKSSLSRLLRRERGLPQRRGQQRAVAPSRLRRVLRLRGRGLSLAEIGRRLGVSRQAVQQMLQKAEPDGGAVEG
jgi:DNA-binding CsgD family transcriptional regulator